MNNNYFESKAVKKDWHRPTTPWPVTCDQCGGKTDYGYWRNPGRKPEVVCERCFEDVPDQVDWCE